MSSSSLGLTVEESRGLHFPRPSLYIRGLLGHLEVQIERTSTEKLKHIRTFEAAVDV